MDNVTHALAGALLAAVATGDEPDARLRRAAFVVGVVAAELPDADLVYAGSLLGMGKLGYLLHHRGHTHTVLLALVGAVLVGGVALACVPALRDGRRRLALLGLAIAGTLSHLLLDFGNSYGVHPFWPFDPAWYYGDAIFIVEPWLWVAALPPLVLLARTRTMRAVLAGLLLIILTATWLVGMVGRDVALACTLGAVMWSLLLWRVSSVPRATRTLGALALTAWCAVYTVFGAASARAQRLVAELPRDDGRRLLDAALSPAIGNPLCFQGLMVERDAITYRVTSVNVAPFPRWRSAGRCAGTASTSALVAGTTREAPVAELREIVATRCDVAAAMQFMRVAWWTRAADGSVVMTDLRFGEGGRGFATIESAAGSAPCPRYVPGWTPPRSDLLGGG